MYHIIHKKYVYIYNYIGTVYIPWKEGEERECQLGRDLDPPAINRRPSCLRDSVCQVLINRLCGSVELSKKICTDDKALEVCVYVYIYMCVCV